MHLIEETKAPEGARFKAVNERDLRAALLKLGEVVARLAKADADKAALADVLRLLDASPPPVPSAADRAEAATERRELAAWRADALRSEPVDPADPRLAKLEATERAILGGAS